MSDRTYSIASSQICPNCVETAHGYEFCDAHLAAMHRTRSASVEPPVLSRAEIDEMIDATLNFPAQ